MNFSGKIIFWTLTIALGFVNPLISFGLIILYYLPEIIQNLCQTCKEVSHDSGKFSKENEEGEKTIEQNNETRNFSYNSKRSKSKWGYFSKRTREELK